MDSASDINATLRAEQMAAASSSGNPPRKKIDARMAAAKRKAREAKAKQGSSRPGGSSLVLPGLMALISALLLASYRFLAPEHKPLGSVTARRAVLQDGRHLAWHEMGAEAEAARHHVLVLHDLKGSRLSMLPNVSEDWLVRHSIRVVSYDRPGYGQSDAFPGRGALSEARDVEWASRDLRLPERFHVVSVGVASYAAWGMLSNISHRLAGAALVSPWESFLEPGLSSAEVFEAWHSIPRTQRVRHLAARLGPLGVSALEKVSEVAGEDWVPTGELPAWAKVNSTVVQALSGSLPAWATQALRDVLCTIGAVEGPGSAAAPQRISEKDAEILTSAPVREYLELIEKEALLQGPGESVFRDWAVVSSKWGFGMSDVKAAVESQGKAPNQQPRISLWHGAEDAVVPPVLTRYARTTVPVDAHEVKGHGHYFYYESEEWAKTILGGLLPLEEMRDHIELTGILA